MIALYATHDVSLLNNMLKLASSATHRYWWLDTSLQPMIDAVRFALDQAGVQYRYEKFPGGRHNERAWGQRIHRPLSYLYGKEDQNEQVDLFD